VQFSVPSDQHSADRRVVPFDKLCRRMQHDVGSEIEWTLQSRC
jgi:hypothetical protein